MQKQHTMQWHSHYATETYHVVALSVKHVTAAYHAMQHIMQRSISCSSILNAIA